MALTRVIGESGLLALVHGEVQIAQQQNSTGHSEHRFDLLLRELHHIHRLQGGLELLLVVHAWHCHVTTRQELVGREVLEKKLI